MRSAQSPHGGLAQIADTLGWLDRNGAVGEYDESRIVMTITRQPTLEPVEHVRQGSTGSRRDGQLSEIVVGQRNTVIRSVACRPDRRCRAGGRPIQSVQLVIGSSIHPQQLRRNAAQGQRIDAADQCAAAVQQGDRDLVVTDQRDPGTKPGRADSIQGYPFPFERQPGQLRFGEAAAGTDAMQNGVNSAG